MLMIASFAVSDRVLRGFDYAPVLLLGLEEPFPESFPFRKVAEEEDHGFAVLLVLHHRAGEKDRYPSRGSGDGFGLVVLEPSPSSPSLGEDRFLDFSHPSRREQAGDVDLPDHFVGGVSEDPFRDRVEEEDVSFPVVSDNSIGGEMDDAFDQPRGNVHSGGFLSWLGPKYP
jgi:hypothetical protein